MYTVERKYQPNISLLSILKIKMYTFHFLIFNYSKTLFCIREIQKNFCVQVLFLFSAFVHII